MTECNRLEFILNRKEEPRLKAILSNEPWQRDSKIQLFDGSFCPTYKMNGPIEADYAQMTASPEYARSVVQEGFEKLTSSNALKLGSSLTPIKTIVDCHVISDHYPDIKFDSFETLFSNELLAPEKVILAPERKIFQVPLKWFAKKFKR